jgi:pyruvate dehydrogenase E2 component (dihydrolipoamide acetyltransferase)
MSNEFRMPSLGPDMESGTLVEWRIKPGDTVQRGDIVALVETDKGIIDVEIFSSGTVEKLLVSTGAHVPVGTVLAQLTGEPSTAEVAATPAQVIPQPAAPAAEPAVIVERQPAAQRQKISPAARARARQLGIDIATLSGSGAGGAITLEDVAKQAATAQPAPAAVEQPHDMRQAIAKAMSRSKREIPHYYLSLTCSFLAARTFIERHNSTASIEQRLLPSALLLRSVALAARALPDFNGFYKEGAFIAAQEVHVGMAIAMRGGRLVAPAILDADRKTLPIVMNELRDLTTRVRAGHMRATELAASTITVTSLAEEGVDLVVPAIYPPQVAIVGFGSILERPWVVDNAVQPMPVLTITVAADHRVTDGRAGARFLAHIRDALQAPEKL